MSPLYYSLFLFVIPFPSKITHLKQGHDMNVVDPVLREQENRSFKHLQQLLKTRMEQFLTDGENQEKTLDTFNARLISQKDFSLIVTEQEWSITLPEMGTFKFKMDSLMKNFLKFFDTEIDAAYHRIIFFRGDSNLELVFKREMEEVNIIPYNPFVSLLTQSRTQISVVSTNQKKTVDEMLSKARKIPEELEFMENTHDFVSIIEGIFLLDSSKSLVYRNARPIFCSLQGDRPRTFKKSTENSEEDYICVKSSKRFRLLSDLHKKYISRIGNEDLSYAQFLSEYQVDHDSKNASDDNDGREENRQVKSYHVQVNSRLAAVDKDELLPAVINLDDGTKIKIRRRLKSQNSKSGNIRRAISSNLKMDSMEFVFSQVLLYRLIKCFM